MSEKPQAAANRACMSADPQTKQVVQGINFDILAGLDMTALVRSWANANIEWAQREVVPKLTGPLSGIMSAILAAVRATLT